MKHLKFFENYINGKINPIKADQVLYHGTAIDKDIKLGETIFHRGADSFGIWFTTNKEGAQKFGNTTTSKGIVYQATVDLKNPLIIEWDNFEKDYIDLFLHVTGIRHAAIASKKDTETFKEYLLSNGYDGIVFKNVEENDISDQTYVVILDKKQIKNQIKLIE